MIRKFDETEQYDTSMKIIFATNNAHKLSEVQAVLGPDFELVTPRSVGITEEIPEQQDTIAGNASQKARYVHDRTGCDCFADDTGLEVEALGGAPGVHSARYATDGHDFAANNRLLLEKLRDSDDRRAHYTCAIALVRPDGSCVKAEGYMHGVIGFEEKGSNGFGYDPLFILPERGGLTAAQISPEEKNRISHRAQALHALLRELGREA